tara:strand:+ start:26256 stop:27155 length:900 start_codon:yes stop_codon:yes gene_type:complete
MEIIMRENFKTTSEGLNRKHVMLKLWEKAKKLGTWNPSEIDLNQDKIDWLKRSESEKDLTSHVTTLFVSGEEAVTIDLLPMISIIANEGHLEEEIYLTSFLWEEAKHVDFFNRYLNEVMQISGDLSRYHSESYKIIFYKELPNAMSRLNKDSSPVALAEAAVTYNLVVEGILAETGYHGWFEILKKAGILSGMSKGIELIQRDESRHLRFGVYLISRLIVEYGDLIWEAVEKKMEVLLPPAVNIINELFDYQERVYGKVAFGLKREDFVDYAVLQFQKRIDRIEKAREKTIDEIILQNI